ncbi:MAG TPA: glycogen synthase [Gemmataceae bacterium]|nr:glycogen synthase [Gemmataceae bacterium]
MPPLKILFLSAEVAPFAKAGGLADVCGSLPKALAALGHDVRVVMPAYAPVEAALRTGAYGVKAHPLTLQVRIAGGLVPAGVLEATLPGSSVPVYFIAERHRFGDRPFFYGFGDDAYRFSFFSRAALDLVIAAQGWRPDLVHAHDWHTAPAVMWLSTAGRTDGRYAGLPTVYTIHNLMHQGTAPWNVCNYLGLITHGLNEEKFGEVNFMARGIFHATMINTVSPTYAREIMGREGGCGLDGLLRYRHFDVHGILNGLDYGVWNPATDRHLAAQFGAETIERRLLNKRALQARAGLPVRDEIPLVAMVTRLDYQKGLDITGHVLHMLMNGYAGEAQCVVLGTGAAHYEGMLRHLAGYHRERMTAFLDYNADLAPLIYGGCDLFLMPSLFEPCGLGQLIAMRYGAVPVVRATGGLADTVRHSVTGFTFGNYSAGDFWNTLREALHIYHVDPESWRSIQRNGMACDYSWATSARAYQQLYQWAIARVRGW